VTDGLNLWRIKSTWSPVTQDVGYSSVIILNAQWLVSATWCSTQAILFLTHCLIYTFLIPRRKSDHFPLQHHLLFFDMERKRFTECKDSNSSLKKEILGRSLWDSHAVCKSAPYFTYLTNVQFSRGFVSIMILV